MPGQQINNAKSFSACVSCPERSGGLGNQIQGAKPGKNVNVVVVSLISHSDCTPNVSSFVGKPLRGLLSI